MSSYPVFIGGLYKSGTSLLRAMLGRHSSLAAGLETNWFDLNWQEKQQQAKRSHQGRRWDATRDIPLQDHLHNLSAAFEIPQEKVTALASQANSAENFISLFLNEYAQKNNKKRWVEKTPANLLHLKRIFENWPDSFFLHVKRHPLDIYASYKDARKWDTPTSFSFIWTHFYSALLQDLNDQKISSQDYLEVQYEQLVTEPEVVMREVAHKIGVPWEKKLAQYPGQSKDYRQVQKVFGKKDSTLERLRKPINTSRIGIWRHKVSKQEVDEIKKQISKVGLRGPFDNMMKLKPHVSVVS